MNALDFRLFGLSAHFRHLQIAKVGINFWQALGLLLLPEMGWFSA